LLPNTPLGQRGIREQSHNINSVFREEKILYSYIFKHGTKEGFLQRFSAFSFFFKERKRRRLECFSVLCLSIHKLAKKSKEEIY